MENSEIIAQYLNPVVMAKHIIELQAKVAELQAQIDALKGAA
jgi:hypothetical protein